MGWLRARLKQVSCIALFAMALQVVLSFGHIHVDQILGASDQSSAPAANAGTKLALAGTADELPAGAGDECAVCALIALANSLILPVPAMLPLPVHFAATHQAPALVFHISQSTVAPFQARAPPLV
jgi:hypothetical protein